jgi:5'-nucleotidase (lipoprotein e(P4) family)
MKEPAMNKNILFGVAMLQLLLLLQFNSSPVTAQSPEQSVTAVLWFQRSAEYRALCYQAYNLAELRIREYLAKGEHERKPAVLFDIDETLLDNSPQEAANILTGKGYSEESWKAWVDKASAATVPGALEFCRWLASNEIEVFYVSNRKNSDGTFTLLNLQKYNFPYPDRNHLFLKGDTSSKEFRRSVIAKQFDIIMLVGDNLSDFATVFEDRTVNFGYAAVDSLRTEFGKRFIVLPNPIYGDWTKPLKGERKGWLKTE